MVAEHAHLEDLVAQLVAHGNAVRAPFRPSQGGMYSVMRDPLDGQLCRSAAEADRKITFDAASDELSCSHCWATIYGGTHQFPTA